MSIVNHNITNTITRPVTIPGTSSATIIRLVTAERTSRPFLQEIWKPRVALTIPNFSNIIQSTPFQKSRTLKITDVQDREVPRKTLRRSHTDLAIKSN